MGHFRLLFSVLFLVVFVSTPAVAQDSWTRGADMIIPRVVHAVGAADGKIYAMGGYITESNTLEEYDPESDSWTRKADMHMGRGEISGCAVVNNKIYLTGGFAGFATLSSLEVYDPAADTWTKKANMPTMRWGHGICHVDEKIYVIGGAWGWPVKKMYETMEVYDIGTDTWTTKEATSTPRWMLSCCVVDGKIYAIGGYDEENEKSLSIVEEYDPETDTWTTKSSMATTRWGFATAELGGKIFAIGGGDPYPVSIVHKAVEVYDPVLDSWSNKPYLPAGRIGIAACSMNGKIYAAGGGGIEQGTAFTNLYIYGTANETDIENRIGLPDSFHLYQNHPNPFQSTTQISFDVPRECHVTLRVYDLLGRPVSTLADRNMNQDSYTVMFNAEGLSSGIYFVTAEIGDYTATKKILLSR
ncbi:MAG: kelch repeat-containing protein [Bacteroidota bacterium]